MPMTPDEIKKALRIADVRQVEIARALGCSKQYVGDVIHGNRRDAEIEQEVANRIGKPVKKVFADVAA